MRETLKNIYDAHQWVRVLLWVSLVGVALLLYVLEGGFPPPVWIQSWQSIHLWAAHSTSSTHNNSLLPMLVLIVRSLVWLAAWLLLLWCASRILRHHRGLQERLVRREAWQTTQRISDLDAFSFPGEHTLARAPMDEEDEEDREDTERGSIELRPPIRLPQHTQFAQYAQSAQSAQHRASQQIQHTPRTSRPIPPRTHAMPSMLHNQNVAPASSAQTASQLVAVKDIADIPTTPVPPTMNTAPTKSDKVRSIESVRETRRNAASRTGANVARVAVEDLPTKPQTPSANTPTAHSAPSPRRTLRLDTSASTPIVAQAKPRPLLTLETGVGWHTGLTRQSHPNEDSVVTLRGMCTYQEQLVPFGLFVVADGMGGHACGQEASRIAIRTLAQSALRDIMQPETLDDKQLIELLARAVEQANNAIYQRGQEWDKDMGTTLTAALIVDTKTSVMAYVVNAGDSRTYLLGKGESLQQITRDHSLVANLVAAGAITPDDVYEHPERNKIYRSLGNNASIDIDWFTRELRSGDTLLLCSDGLWEMVRDPEIERILRQPIEPTAICNHLIQSALKGGGADNISAIVVRIS